jgi:hypothetical protein
VRSLALKVGDQDDHMQAGPLFVFDDAWRRLRPHDSPAMLSEDEPACMRSSILITRLFETSNHPPAISNAANTSELDSGHIQLPTHHTTNPHNGLVRRFFCAACASSSRTLQGRRLHSTRPWRSRSMLGRPRQFLQVSGSPQHHRQRAGGQEGKRSVRAGA